MFIDLALCFFRAYALSQFAQHFASNSHGPKAFSPVPLRTHDAPVSERDRHALGEICLSDNRKYHRAYRPSQRRNPYVYRETFVFPEGKFAVLFFTEEALLARACVQCGCVRRGVVSGSTAGIVRKTSFELVKLKVAKKFSKRKKFLAPCTHKK